jgi:hypothetical protein
MASRVKAGKIAEIQMREILEENGFTIISSGVENLLNGEQIEILKENGIYYHSSFKHQRYAPDMKVKKYNRYYYIEAKNTMPWNRKKEMVNNELRSFNTDVEIFNYEGVNVLVAWKFEDYEFESQWIDKLQYAVTEIIPHIDAKTKGGSGTPYVLIPRSALDPLELSLKRII